MGSTFAGLSLFDSGPHRFAMWSVGRLVLGPLDGLNQDVRSLDLAERELHIDQRGRLVAPDDAGLWAQVDAIRAQAELPQTGTLVDHSGRSWASMTLVWFRPDETVDRGRVVSMGYRAHYLRFG